MDMVRERVDLPRRAGWCGRGSISVGSLVLHCLTGVGMAENEEELRVRPEDTSGDLTSDSGDFTEEVLRENPQLKEYIMDVCVTFSHAVDRKEDPGAALMRLATQFAHSESGLSRANQMRTIAEASVGARHCMFESYEGVVKHVDDDQVIVVYEVEEDLVEQTYVAKQFVDGKLPKPGDRLAVFVHVAQLPDEQDETMGEKASDEQRRRPEKFVPLPRTF